jgi:hypothetical protein
MIARRPAEPYMRRMKRFLITLTALACGASTASSQTLSAWENFDFAHKRIDSAPVANLSLAALRSLRGIVFGRHGRPFTDEADVQAYLKTRSWYRPNPAFSNASLSAMEKANIDVIRRAEMTKHPQIETGDIRYLKDKPITVKMLGHHTAPDWEVLEAEISATHGARFESDDPGDFTDDGKVAVSPLQQYFDDRYWYHRRDDYSPKLLSAVERANLDTILLARMRDLGFGVSPGLMYLFSGDATDGFAAPGAVALRPASPTQRGLCAARPALRDAVAARVLQGCAVVHAARRFHDRGAVAEREGQHQGDPGRRSETARAVVDRQPVRPPARGLVS